MTHMGKKNTILVVDDEEDFGNTLALTLTRLGHFAVTCTNPCSALHLVHSQPDRFDVAIVDEMMPDMRGTQLTTQLLRIKDDLSVILLTGYGSLLPVEQVRAAGLRAVLTKPVLQEQLRAVLDKVNMREKQKRLFQ